MIKDAPDAILSALLLALSAKLSFSSLASCLLPAQLTLQMSDLTPEQVNFIRELLVLSDQLCCKADFLLKQVLPCASCHLLCLAVSEMHLRTGASLALKAFVSAAVYLTTVFCRAAVLASLVCSLAARAVGPADRAISAEA